MVNAGGPQWKTARALALIALALLVWSGAARAQRLVVLTQSLTATREAARVYAHSVDFGGAGLLPGAFPLPGRTAAGPLLLSPTGEAAAASTGPAWRGGIFEPKHTYTMLSGIKTAPFNVPGELRRDSDAGWREWAAALLPAGPDAPARAVVLGIRRQPEGMFTGRLRVSPWPGTPPGYAPVSWRLPGRPAALAVLTRPDEPAGQRAPYLGTLSIGTGLRDAVLTVGNAGGGTTRSVTLSHPDGVTETGSSTVALAQAPGAGPLYALVSGYALENGGEVRSWLYCLNATDFRPAAPPLAVRGAANATRALQPLRDGRCWVATRIPGTDFAYATLVRREADALEKEAQYALTGVTHAFSIAPAPGGTAVAVAVEHRLELWPDNRRAEISAVYDAPCALLRWTPEGLFLGEGNRLHAVHPETAQPLETIAFQSGWLHDAVAVPRQALPRRDADGDGLSYSEEVLARTDPEVADTDGDGIHDGIDPAPREPSPRLEAPAELVFHGEAVGDEVRALSLGSKLYDGAYWQIHPAETLPWLIYYPRGGKAPGMSLLGIEPARLPPGNVTGTLNISLTDVRGQSAAGSPDRVTVRVAPARRQMPRILWVWAEPAAERLRGPHDARRLGALAALLAGPPHYFAHHEVAGPFQEALSQYSIVVLDSAAASRGALAQTVLLDFVAEGGALLFLGGHLSEPGERTLEPWLAPLGVRIDAGTLVQGTFASENTDTLTRHWEDFALEQGCLIQAAPAHTRVPAPGTEQGAVFAACPYGYGRAALLAAPTPLTTARLDRPAHRGFARDLFRWLKAAGTEYRDLDGDGLTDETEDPKNVQVVDPGETDYLNPDTDADGIPDGMEDTNRNGRVDDGETDPRNADSDGDGVLDGADASPCPVFGAPRIAGITPARGPAEGGAVVVLRGSNFTPDSVVWFGARQAPWLEVADTDTVVARTPEAQNDEGGSVDVRIVTAGGRFEGVLPVGFMYAPRRRVTLTLAQVGRPVYQDGAWTGQVSVRYRTEEQAVIARAVLVLAAEPSQNVVWTHAMQPAGPRAATATVTGHSLPDGLYLTSITLERLRQPREGELVRLQWRCANEDAAALRIQIPRYRLTHPAGGAFLVQSSDLKIELPHAPAGG